MSKTLRYDPPLVRALADELNARLARRGVHATPLFDRTRTATLLLDRGEALTWHLHPTRGWPILGACPPGLERRPIDARITRVAAPPDERLLYIDLAEGGRFRGTERRLVIELQTNQWNALLVDRTSRNILSVLRAREAGDRVLRPHATYAPPAARPRTGSGDEDREDLRVRWLEELAPLSTAERRAALLAGWADVSPLNVDALVSLKPEPAFVLWWRIRKEPARPVLLTGEGVVQPYPCSFPGRDAQPVASLLAAFTIIATRVEAAPADSTGPLLAAATRRLSAIRRRLDRLRAQAAAPGDSADLRAQADLLLANLEAVPQGVEEVVLQGFEGGQVVISLDPALRPSQNADALYERARRMDRTSARLPELIRSTEAEEAAWLRGIAALETGEVPNWIRGKLGQPRGESLTAAERPRLPYRTYRTSGGLEVRVGRTRADNDRLTFHVASPDDVWLHAREVPGSHVVLRWRNAEPPPARDLEEAAALAAWHSRARTSGTVAVDWTRRRYVRKPRGAPPGRVLLVKAKTILVAPSDREPLEPES